jgi:gamma-glutamylputrescine oxidase
MHRTTDPAGHPLWNDRASESFSPLEGEVRADLCVVGLGGSGLSCVREAQRLGARVVGLDAGPVGGGAAGRNGGFLLAGLAPFYHDARRRYGREAARALYRLTVAELDRIAAESPAEVFRSGSLRIAVSAAERDDCAEQLAALREDGFTAEPYDGPEGTGLLFPGDGSFQPLARCRALAQSAVGAGAALHEQSAALHIERGLVRTASGVVRCSHVVIAVDGGLEHLLPELNGRVRTARLQMLASAPTDEARIPRPVYARWGYDYWQQLADGRLVLGGFRDLGGDEEWTDSATPSERVQGELERFLREKLCVRAPITHRWAATVSYSTSDLPVLEEVRPGVVATGAYSGTGNVLGALCGRGAARLALGERSEITRLLAA